MVDQRGTLTPAEHQALDFLTGGPALLGPRTETVTSRRLPRLYDTVNDTPASARLRDIVAGPRDAAEVRTVDVKVARRLAKFGLVVIDNGSVRLPEPPA